MVLEMWEVAEVRRRTDRGLNPELDRELDHGQDYLQY